MNEILEKVDIKLKEKLNGYKINEPLIWIEKYIYERNNKLYITGNIVNENSCVVTIEIDIPDIILNLYGKDAIILSVKDLLLEYIGDYNYIVSKKYQNIVSKRKFFTIKGAIDYINKEALDGYREFELHTIGDPILGIPYE